MRTVVKAGPQFMAGVPSRFDINQGGLGDCGTVASFAGLAVHEMLFYRVCPLDQSFTENYAGIFHFRFWQYGKYVLLIKYILMCIQPGL